MNTSAPSAPAQPTSAGPLLALGLLALLWGYNWVVMKTAMRYVGPMDFAGLRGALGAILLLGMLWAMGAPMRPKHVVKTIFLGLFQTAGFVGLISWALNSGASGKSAVLGHRVRLAVPAGPFARLAVAGRGIDSDRPRARPRALGRRRGHDEQPARARRGHLVGSQRHHFQENTRRESQRPSVGHSVANGLRRGAARH